MKFDYTLVPAGIAAKNLRAFLRKYRHVGWKAVDEPPDAPDPPYRIERVEITKWFERDLADALVEKELLEETSPAQYRVTELGNRLAPQSLAPRITREKADKIVTDFLERVRKVNADPEAVRYVIKVIAFGSYIRDTDDLGDIDLVVMTAPRAMSREERRRRFAALKAKFGEDHWPGTDLKKRLRNRNRYLSFHPELDLRDGDDRRVIFKAPIEGAPGSYAIWAI
jgi:predicted nucleotidyltransferase